MRSVIMIPADRDQLARVRSRDCTGGALQICLLVKPGVTILEESHEEISDPANAILGPIPHSLSYSHPTAVFRLQNSIGLSLPGHFPVPGLVNEPGRRLARPALLDFAWPSLDGNTSVQCKISRLSSTCTYLGLGGLLVDV